MYDPTGVWRGCRALLLQAEDGQDAKGVGAEAIAERPSGKAAKNGDGDQNPE